jgi:hypothetical protein
MGIGFFLRFPKMEVTPRTGWFISWMITRVGYPILGNLHIGIYWDWNRSLLQSWCKKTVSPFLAISGIPGSPKIQGFRHVVNIRVLTFSLSQKKVHWITIDTSKLEKLARLNEVVTIVEPSWNYSSRRLELPYNGWFVVLFRDPNGGQTLQLGLLVAAGTPWENGHVILFLTMAVVVYTISGHEVYILYILYVI